MKAIYTFVCITLLSLTSAMSQPLLNSFGIGFLDLSVCKDGEVWLPYYEDINGKGAGQVSFGMTEYMEYSNIDVKGGKNHNIIKLVNVQYERSGIVVYEERDGWFKIRTIDEQENYWVNSLDLKARFGVYWNWQDFIVYEKMTLFPDVLEINMNLRDQPAASGKKIITMTDDSFFVTPTGNRKGLWIEVNVEKVKGSYCEDMGVLANYKGWIKILDDTGHPNMWYYTGGC